MQENDLLAQLERYRVQLLEISDRLNQLEHGTEADDVLMVADALSHTMAALGPDPIPEISKVDPVLAAFVHLNSAVHRGNNEPWVIQARNALRWKDVQLPLGLPTLKQQDLLDLTALRSHLDETAADRLDKSDDEAFQKRSNWAHRVDRAISVLMAHGAFRSRPIAQRAPTSGA